MWLAVALPTVLCAEYTESMGKRIGSHSSVHHRPRLINLTSSPDIQQKTLREDSVVWLGLSQGYVPQILTKLLVILRSRNWFLYGANYFYPPHPIPVLLEMPGNSETKLYLGVARELLLNTLLIWNCSVWAHVQNPAWDPREASSKLGSASNSWGALGSHLDLSEVVWHHRTFVRRKGSNIWKYYSKENMLSWSNTMFYKIKNAVVSKISYHFMHY